MYSRIRHNAYKRRVLSNPLLQCQIHTTHVFKESRPPTPISAVSMPVLKSLSDLFPRTFLKKTNVCGTIVAIDSNARVFQTAKEQLGLNPKCVGLSGKFYSECPTAISYLTTQVGIKHYLPHFLSPYHGTTIRDYYAMEESIRMANNFPLIRIKHGKVVEADKESVLQKSLETKLQAKYKSLKPTVNIETTSSGNASITQSASHPTIMMSNCAIKRELEPTLIADQIFNAISARYPEFKTQSLKVGVIGYGAIGKAWTELLLKYNHQVHVYDSKSSKLPDMNIHPLLRMHSFPEEMIGNSQFIFNCSTSDFTEEKTTLSFLTPDNQPIVPGSYIADVLRTCPTKKVLISCSSDATAFKRLIHQIEPHNSDPFADLVCGNIRVLNRGFPINFTRQGDASDPLDIQLTRATLLGSTLCAKAVTNLGIPSSHLPRRIMVDPEIQQFIVKKFVESNPNPYKFFTPKKLAQFKNIQWIRENSGGEHIEMKDINKALRKR